MPSKPARSRTALLKAVGIRCMRLIDLKDDGMCYSYVVKPGTRKYFPGPDNLKFEFREIDDGDDNRLACLCRDSYGYKFYFENNVEGYGEIYLHEYSCGEERILVHETQIEVIYIHLESN